MYLGKITQEAAFHIGVLGGVTLFAGTPRLVKLFDGANAWGIRYPFIFDSIAVCGIAIAHERDKVSRKNAFGLRLIMTFSISPAASYLLRLHRKTIHLPFKASVMLGTTKTLSIAYSSSLFFPAKKKQTGTQNTYRIGQDGKITIEVFQKDLIHQPVVHLKSFSEQLSKTSCQELNVSVTFISEEGVGKGLFKDYVDTLFKEIRNLNLFQGSHPVAEKEDDFITFKHMGEAFMHLYQNNCLNKDFISSGVHFDDIIFEAALIFDAKELDGDFRELSEGTKLKVASILAPDSARHFSENSADQLTVEFYNQRVAAIFALAQGMKLKYTLLNPNGNWDLNIKKVAPYTLSGNIQGVIEKNEIIQKIQHTSRTTPHFTNKVKWIKEWIKLEASELELKLFLKFATGQSSIPVLNSTSYRIFIAPITDAEPFPSSNTCDNLLFLSNKESEVGGFNDKTKEDFIKCLKIVIHNDSFYTLS